MEVDSRITEAIGKFPTEFGLRGFPGKRFTINEYDSYFETIDGKEYMRLYVHIVREDGTTDAFAKANSNEVELQMVHLPSPKTARDVIRGQFSYPSIKR